MNKISIVTPCYNSATYIGETVKSVLNQKAVLQGRCELEYIICDGNSSDDTLGRIQVFSSHSEFKSVKILSQPDAGMYDALVKGFKQCSGDIVAYINSDDYYNENAFDIVLDLFENKNVKWLTGLNTFYNQKSQIVRVELPYKYRRIFFECGCYGTFLPFIQQESTFWHASLQKAIDFDYLSSLKYAGDFYIWKQFSKEQELCIVEAYLGGFRFREGQLSAAKEKYLEEMNLMTHNLKFWNKFLLLWDKVIWMAPAGLKKKFNQNQLIRFDQNLQDWV